MKKQELIDKLSDMKEVTGPDEISAYNDGLDTAIMHIRDHVEECVFGVLYSYDGGSFRVRRDFSSKVPKGLPISGRQMVVEQFIGENWVPLSRVISFNVNVLPTEPPSIRVSYIDTEAGANE